MTKAVPPRIAAWMLHHLGRTNDALTGDLLEEFQRRRSAGWYWRQVLRAILVGRSGALLFVLGMLMLFRVGTLLPVPGANRDALVLSPNGTGGLWKYDVMTGGNLSLATVFALGLAPYVSASIIVQAIAIAWWALRRRTPAPWDLPIVRATWVTAILLCGIQAAGLALFLERQGGLAGGLPLVAAPGWLFRISTILTVTSGTVCLMWMSDRLTRRRIGNGMFLACFAALLAGSPGLVDSGALPMVLSRLVIAIAIVGVTSIGYRRALHSRGVRL